MTAACLTTILLDSCDTVHFKKCILPVFPAYYCVKNLKLYEMYISICSAVRTVQLLK